MRVTWVTSQLPSPRAGAGEVLEFELLRFAAAHHDIHLISSEIVPGTTVADLEAIGVRYEGVSWQRSFAPQRKLALLWYVATKDSGKSFWQQGDRARVLGSALERASSSSSPDLIQVVGSETAPVLASATRPRVLVLFDAHVRQAERELVNAHTARGRLFWRAQLRKLGEWERTWYRLADGVACNSGLDADALSVLLGRDVEVVPNPVPSEFYAEPASPRSDHLVTFVAHLGYRPNVDAALWFTDAIWPSIVERVPAATLQLVGRNPVAEVLAAAERAGASVEQNVPDVRPYYWESAVAVAPIRLGSGLRNKVLHAMACGAPLVATPVAVEGIDVDVGRDLLVAGDAPRFADAVVECLRRPEEARARAANARRYVASYRAEAVGGRLVEWWDRLSGTTRSRTIPSSPERRREAERPDDPPGT